MGVQIVSFILGNEEYGIDISKVREIIIYQGSTKMPRLPEYMEGIVNIRGKVIPVLDLKRKLGIDGETVSERCAMIVEFGKQQVAMLVDGVNEVQEIADSNIEAAPSICSSERPIICGIGKIGERLCILLDVAAILSAEEMFELEKVG